MKRRQSQVVQQNLPRPTDINTSILRGAPHKDQKYRELYKVSLCYTTEYGPHNSMKQNGMASCLF